MILCPKCGKVNEYTTIEFSRRTGVYNENGECLRIKNLVTYKKDDPRCSNCRSKVKFFIDESEGVKE